MNFDPTIINLKTSYFFVPLVKNDSHDCTAFLICFIRCLLLSAYIEFSGSFINSIQNAGCPICFWYRCITWCFGSSNFECDLLHGSVWSLFICTAISCPILQTFLRFPLQNLKYLSSAAGWDPAFSASPLHLAQIAPEESISPVSSYPLAWSIYSLC